MDHEHDTFSLSFPTICVCFPSEGSQMNLQSMLVPVQVKYIYLRPDKPFKLAVKVDFFRLYLVNELR